MTTLWARQALTERGWERDVCVEIGADGRLESVIAGAAPQGEQLDVLLPAPTNLHSHAFQRAMAGLAEGRGTAAQDSFWTWRELMYRFLDRLTPEDIGAIAAYVQMTMQEAGYAAVAEFHYLHHAADGSPYADPAETSARIVAAADATGIGLTLLPVLYQYGGCDRRPLEAGQRRFGNDPEQFARLHDAARRTLAALPADCRLGGAAHSLRAVSPEGLAAVASVTGAAPMHMHLAEQTAEVEEVRAAHGRRPAEWLLDNVEVSPRWCLIHCTQMEPHEIRALAATGAVAGLCPITEANLGDGTFDGPRWLGAGGQIGIGSDSNVRIALAEELRSLEYSQRLRDRSRAVLATAAASTGRRLFEATALGGAQAAGRDAGRIAPGRLADLLALDTTAADYEGLEGDALLDAWIFAGDDQSVRELWSAGRHMVSGGQHKARDAIDRDYRTTLQRLREVL